MNIYEFAEKNDIVIITEIDLIKGKFEIIKRDIQMESYSLFEQIILCNSIENIELYLKDQSLPRIWTQGNSKCVISKPNKDKIVALFYDNYSDAKTHYFYALQLDAMLKEIEW